MASFIHPLARSAQVWRAEGAEGSGRDILVIVTTLDPGHRNHKAGLVARLAEAARSWITETTAAEDFILIARPKDWP